MKDGTKSTFICSKETGKILAKSLKFEGRIDQHELAHINQTIENCRLPWSEKVVDPMLRASLAINEHLLHQEVEKPKQKEYVM